MNLAGFLKHGQWPLNSGMDFVMSDRKTGNLKPRSGYGNQNGSIKSNIFLHVQRIDTETSKKNTMCPRAIAT